MGKSTLLNSEERGVYETRGIPDQMMHSSRPEVLPDAATQAALIGQVSGPPPPRPCSDEARRSVTGVPGRETHAGPSALQQGLSATPKGQIYLRVDAAASPSHGLCRPPLSGSSRLRCRRLQSAAGARPRGARGHTPLRRRPRPPSAFRSASRDVPRHRRSARPAVRSPPPSPEDLQSLESLEVCALRSAPLVLLPAGVAGPWNRKATPRRGSATLQLQRALRAPGPRDGLQRQVWAWGCALPAAASPPLPAPLPTYRAAGWGAGLAGVERPVHLPRGSRVLTGRGALWRARREVRPDQGGLASAPPGGRLQLLSESLSHVCGRCSYRDGGGGGAGLGAIIWEDAVPCPAGAVVSPLKKPAPHCSPAAAAGSQGHLLGVGSEGTAAPAPGCGARGAPRRLLVEGWPAVGAREKPRYEPGSTALRPLSGRDSQWGPSGCRSRSRSAATRCQSDPSSCRPHSQPGVTQAASLSHPVVRSASCGEEPCL
ncbi:PREDICTED: uncharacterized protein LOC108518011 [Rhinopithecus bieti]|uniref:uncharacterized protein LOC108518011 n=1 Tax=Rhinopithecus bieti TaxID=61621 RepID=UPI00083C0E41|nr:PREDICTED: uncharacterized protein LOC108518011 [Rhinopithecus bieti]